MELIQNLGYILMGFIALISVFLIVLALLEKKLQVRVLKGKYTRNHFYIEKLSKLDIKNTSEGLKIFDSIIRAFFKEAFHIKGSPDYSELETLFIKKHNNKAINLCNNMKKFLYSKEPITQQQLQDLVKLLAEIISSNKIISKEEKFELDKKSIKMDSNKPSILNKIHIPGISKKKSNNKKDQSNH